MKMPDYLRVKVVPSTIQIIVEAVTEELVPVVRCKDCKHSIDYYNDGGCYCRKPHADNGLDYIADGWNWYCADGERKEDVGE